MIVFYILIFILSAYGIRYRRNGFFNDYIGKEQCNAIKGVFILVVFCRHIVPYILETGYKFDGLLDKSFIIIDSHIGQLLVVMFLFYSGYGVMESIKKKGVGYIKGFPRKRILATLINFDVAVLFFLVLNIIVGKVMDVHDIMLAFTGWTSIGNSNWYIFVILFCYLFTYIGFSFQNNNIDKGSNTYVYITLGLIFIFFVILRLTKQFWWYNTIMAYPAGLLYSNYKEKIEHVVKSRYLLCLLLTIGGFLLFYELPYALKGARDNIVAVLFSLIIVLMTLKVQIKNKPLIWLGSNLFPLYIYQRVPMIAIASIDDGRLVSMCPYLYVTVCLVLTLGIGYCYKYWRII